MPLPKLHFVVVVIPGPAISFCHKVLCFLPRLFVCLFVFFFGSLVIVVACYRVMQRITVIKGLKITAVFLQVLRSTVIVCLNCGAQ